MGNLKEEVSILTKDLHHIIHLLQAQMAVRHYTAPMSSCPYGVHMMSNSSVSLSPAYILGSSIHMQHKDHVVPKSQLGSTSWSHNRTGGMTKNCIVFFFFSLMKPFAFLYTSLLSKETLHNRWHHLIKNFLWYVQVDLVLNRDTCTSMSLINNVPSQQMTRVPMTGAPSIP